MKIERTKNATRNIIFGWIVKIYQIFVPFLLRTAMIYFMGIEYVGLNSLFTSVLQVLNLAELGVGSAMVYSMYKPIAENDTNTICALMKLYKTYYHIIGLVIAVIGVILTPFIPRLISGEVPNEINVYILYLMHLGATVLSYWLFAYKNSILQAHQRVDVINKVTLITNTIQYILQFLTLVIFHNYYLYILISLFTQALTNILTAVEADRMYPNYKAKGKLEKRVVQDINHRIRDLFTSKVGTVIVSSVDTIVISAFLGLTVLAIYQNYFYIMKSIIQFVAIIFTACMAGIGNSIITESREKNFNDLKKFTFLVCWLTGFCTCCFLCLYQPFMKIWVGEDLMLDFLAVILFCLYFYIYEINQLLNTFKDAAGIWHEDRFRPLVVAIFNLCMNLILVQIWGIYGVLLASVIAWVFIGLPWLLHNLFTVLFEKSSLKIYLRKLFSYTVVVLVSCIICCMICSLVNLGDWITFIIRLLICCIVPNVFYFLVYRKKPEFKQCVQLLDKMSGNKFNLEKW